MHNSTLYLFIIAVVMSSGAAFGQPNDFAEQLLHANEEQFTHIFSIGVDNSMLTETIVPLLTTAIERKLPPDAADKAKDELAKQQANAAVALLRLNHPSKVWPLLKHSPDPRARSYLIHRLGPLGVDSKIIIERLEAEPDITIRRALILSLGEFDAVSLPWENRNAIVPQLQEMYRVDADPGLHSAVEWLFRKWHDGAWLKQVNEEWANDKEMREKRLNSIAGSLAKENPTPQWYVNSQGQTMVVIPGPVEFTMGSPYTEAGRGENETRHKRRIGRTFAIASKSVTMEQYLEFDKLHTMSDLRLYRYNDNDDFIQYKQREKWGIEFLPVFGVSWHKAAAYCNWLSKSEGYPEVYEIDRGAAKLKLDGLSLAGYRLPTEAEMEYSIRAGATTARYFGDSVELLEKYAHYWGESLPQKKRSKPARCPIQVTRYKPNDFGLFDMQGNLFTWCQDRFADYPISNNGEAIDDNLLSSDSRNREVLPLNERVIRGGAYQMKSGQIRSAYRHHGNPVDRRTDLGLRPARTIPLD